MSVFDETWTWDQENEQIVSDAPKYHDDPDKGPRVVVETDSGFYPPHGAERNLIAAAPELVRALRAIEWRHRERDFERRCPYCDGYETRDGEPRTGHDPDCIVYQALSKAGAYEDD
jgi:hypothetical protein